MKANGVSTEFVYTFEGQPVPPAMKDAGALLVMGGPMGVYEQERYPFLADEMRLIERALKEEKPVLGVCLGSQLLAAALGAAVTKGKQKEIGWYPIKLTESSQNDPLWSGVDRSFTALHWHGDIFELPKRAVSLASSDLTACQAFRYGPNAYGILFHMETTEGILGEMIKTFCDELKEAGVDGCEVARNAAEYLPRLNAIGRLVFERWARLAQSCGK